MEITVKPTISYSADGRSNTFDFPFDYLRKSFISVSVNGDNVPFIVEGKQVVLDEIPPVDSVVVISRNTSTTRLNSWMDASVLKASDMTLQQTQMLHILEETIVSVKDWIYDVSSDMGQPNVIEAILVNGVKLKVNVDKEVEITVPLKVSELENDKGYLTEHQSLDGYATETWVLSKKYLTEHQSLEGLAREQWVLDKHYLTEHQDISGKADKSEIPTNVSQLNNDVGYLTQHQSLAGLASEQWVLSRGYLTEHQDISGKADKSEIPTKISQLNNDSDYIKSSEIPTTSRAAGVKAGNWLSIDDGSTNAANRGKMKCGELTKAQYQSATGYTFISKTTLGNVLSDYATKVEMSEAIAAAISGGDIDLSGFYTKAEVDNLLENIDVPEGVVLSVNGVLPDENGNVAITIPEGGGGSGGSSVIDGSAIDDFIIEKGTSADGSQWYRLWNSGWLEQGGQVYFNSDSTITINLIKSYANTTYHVAKNYYSITDKSRNSTLDKNWDITVYKTISSFKTWCTWGGETNFSWYTCGQAAESEYTPKALPTVANVTDVSDYYTKAEIDAMLSNIFQPPTPEDSEDYIIFSADKNPYDIQLVKNESGSYSITDNKINFSSSSGSAASAICPVKLTKEIMKKYSKVIINYQSIGTSDASIIICTTYSWTSGTILTRSEANTAHSGLATFTYDPSALTVDCYLLITIYRSSCVITNIYLSN